MSGGVHVGAISALDAQRDALRSFADSCTAILDGVQATLRSTADMLEQLRDEWEKRVKECEAALERAEAALSACLESTDVPGICFSQQMAVTRASATLDDAIEHRDRVRKAIGYFNEAVDLYRPVAGQQWSAIEQDIPNAMRYLEEVAGKLYAITTLAIPQSLGIAASSPFTSSIAAPTVAPAPRAAGYAPEYALAGPPDIGRLVDLVRAERPAAEARERQQTIERERGMAERQAQATPRTPEPQPTAPEPNPATDFTPRGGNPEREGTIETEPSPEAVEGGARRPIEAKTPRKTLEEEAIWGGRGVERG